MQYAQRVRGQRPRGYGFSPHKAFQVPLPQVVLNPTEALVRDQDPRYAQQHFVQHPTDMLGNGAYAGQQMQQDGLGTLATLAHGGAMAQKTFRNDPLAGAFTPGIATPQPEMVAQEPAVVILARGVRVRSKLVSWSGYSWPWILFVLTFVAANGALMILAGLDMTGIGIASPILLGIWHFVLFVIFGALLIWTYVRFANETLLEDKIRLPLLCCLATIYNFAMSIGYLLWMLHNTSAYAEVHFSSNSQAYVSCVGLNTATFVWYFVVVSIAMMSWIVHYNQRKTLELIDMVLSTQDEHLGKLHRTTLKDVVASLRWQQQDQL
jgi:hypothetical protein